MNSDFGGWNYLIIFLWRLRRKKKLGVFFGFWGFSGDTFWPFL
jgi:hypothetical protein